MKNLFLTPVASLFSIVFMLLIASCDSSEANTSTLVPDSSASSAIHRDTTMPDEPLKAAVAATDSVTPNAQNTTDDSIGSKISIHHGKVKVVDTTKRD